MTYRWLFQIFYLFCLVQTASLRADPNLEQLLKRFETYADEQRKLWEVPGMAIGIVKGNDVLLLKGYGQRGLKDKEPVNDETIFQIGSLSKAFTSALVAIGEDRKLFKWDDKVISHLPAFQLFDLWVTQQFEIVDLLAQRSGLPAYAGDTQAFLGTSPDQMIRNLQYIRPAASFRAAYAYQNIFFTVAGKILELKTGLSLSALLKKELFTPLEMHSTTFSLEEFLSAPNRAEWLIRKPGGAVIPLDPNYPGREWNYLLGAAGGINSNAKDMVNWLKLQVNKGMFNKKQLISSKNLHQTHRPYIFAMDADNHDTFYALGWLYTDYSPHPIIWHNGATLGVYNVVAFIPEEQLGIVVLSNVRDTLLAQALAFQFFDFYYGKEGTNWSQLLLNIIQEKEKKDQEKRQPTNIFPPMPLDNYVGTYHHPIYGNVKVEKESDQTLRIPMGNGIKWQLKPYQRDVFTLVWPGVDETGTKVSFYSEGKEAVTTMDIEMISKEGSGLFQKI